MRRRGAFAFALLSALGVGCWEAGPAEAQELEGVINVQKFSPAPGPGNFIVTRGLRSDGEHAIGFDRQAFALAIEWTFPHIAKSK